MIAVLALGGILMSKIPRPKPKRLPEKLKQIRQSLNLSQNELLKMLGIADE